MTAFEERHLVNVEVRAANHLAYSDLSPLLDALAERLDLSQPIYAFEISATRNIMDPPAAGPQAVALLVSFSVDLADIAKDAAKISAAYGISRFVATFMDEMAKDSWKYVRTQLTQLAKKGRHNTYEREFQPLAIVVNGVRVYFEGELADEEFSRRLLLAKEYLMKLPDSAFTDQPHAAAFGLHWDETSNAWHGPVRKPQGESKEQEA